MSTTRIHPVPHHGPTDGARGARPAGAGGPSAERWEEANRLGLLTVHGMVGTFAGTFILFNGTAKVLEDHGAWFRPFTGTLALVGGVLLLLGLGLHRNLRLEVAGLVGLAAWDLLMAVGFGASVAKDDVLVTWPWDPASSASGARLYPIALYLGLFMMMCVHLYTLRRIRAARP